MSSPSKSAGYGRFVEIASPVNRKREEDSKKTMEEMAARGYFSPSGVVARNLFDVEVAAQEKLNEVNIKVLGELLSEKNAGEVFDIENNYRESKIALDDRRWQIDRATWAAQKDVTSYQLEAAHNSKLDILQKITKVDEYDALLVDYEKRLANQESGLQIESNRRLLKRWTDLYVQVNDNSYKSQRESLDRHYIEVDASNKDYIASWQKSMDNSIAAWQLTIEGQQLSILEAQAALNETRETGESSLLNGRNLIVYSTEEAKHTYDTITYPAKAKEYALAIREVKGNKGVDEIDWWYTKTKSDYEYMVDEEYRSTKRRVQKIMSLNHMESTIANIEVANKIQNIRIAAKSQIEKIYRTSVYEAYSREASFVYDDYVIHDNAYDNPDGFVQNRSEYNSMVSAPTPQIQTSTKGFIHYAVVDDNGYIRGEYSDPDEGGNIEPYHRLISFADNPDTELSISPTNYATSIYRPEG